MEENQDLQDIILDREEENGGASKAKKIITTVILLIILFLIVIIVVKLLNSEEEPAVAPNTANTLILPDEPIAPEPAPQTSEETMPEQTYEPTPIASDEPIPSVTQVTDAPAITQEKPAIQTAPEPKVEKRPEPKVEKKPEPKVEKKPEPKKVEPKAEKKVEQKPRIATPAATPNETRTASAKSGGSANVGSYVQVSSIQKLDENNALLKKIKSLGYSYKTHETTVNGKKTIKVLVGPFEGAELKTKLNQIKADITKDAFIYKVK